MKRLAHLAEQAKKEEGLPTSVLLLIGYASSASTLIKLQEEYAKAKKM
jgi:hypothetical protein